MKKLSMILAAFFLVAMFYSCSEDFLTKTPRDKHQRMSSIARKVLMRC